MSVCSLDHSGFCIRHQRIHNDSEKQWALSDSLIGFAFRREWDRQLQKETTKAEKKATPVCVHLGDALPSHMQLTASGKPCENCGEKLRKCGVYAICTTKIKRKGVACCNGCSDRVTEADQ